MVLEFGWGISDTGVELPEINGKNISEYMKNLRKRSFKINRFVSTTSVVYTFGYDVDEQGGYSGTITIISRGDNVLNQTIENLYDDDETVTRFSPRNFQNRTWN